MAKANRAKELTDMPVGNDDPISELSDIMKFDPVEAVLDQTGEALQLDLEHELMGDLAEIENELRSEAKSADGKGSRLAGIPGMDEPGKVEEDEDWGELAGEDLDGSFEELFDQSLEDAEEDEHAQPSVPPELESQLNHLLAGLGTSERTKAAITAKTDGAAKNTDADRDASQEAAVEPDEESSAELDEMHLADDTELAARRDDDAGEDDVSGEIEPPEEGRSANGHDDDPLAKLIAMVGDDRKSPGTETDDDEDGDTAPDIETADIVDEPVPVEDDLDIPDVSFENDIPSAPDFDDLDAEFSQAFNKLTEYDKVLDSERPAARFSAEKAVEPHLGEKLDSIFAEMSQTASAASIAAASRAREFEPSTGSERNWLDDFPDDGSDPGPVRSVDSSATAQEDDGGGRGRGILIAMIVAAIAVAGGIGAFALSFGGGDETSGPALVKADDGPVKVKPKDPGGKTVPNEDKKVYERVAGSEQAETPTQEKLISTKEEPVDVAAKAPEPRVIVPNPVEPVEPAEPVPAEKNDDRIVPEAEATDTGTPAEVVAVKPRRVKTLIVKPDGTLVAREEPEPDVANELRAAVPDAPEAMTAKEQTDAAAETAEETARPAEVAAVNSQQTGAEEREVAFQPPAGEEAVAVDGGENPAGDGVVVEGIPLPTPAPRAEMEAAMAAAAAEADTIRNQPAESELKPAEATAPEKPETVTAAAEPAPAVASEWWVQISSQPSRESAQASYAELASRYGSIIGGRGVNIVRADIEGKGIYYRVRIAGGSRSEATELCSRLKDAGAGCFIAR